MVDNGFIVMLHGSYRFHDTHNYSTASWLLVVIKTQISNCNDFESINPISLFKKFELCPLKVTIT